MVVSLVPEISVIRYNYYPFNRRSDNPGIPFWRENAMFEYDNDADGQGTPDWSVWFEQSNERGTLLGIPLGYSRLACLVRGGQ